MKIFICYRQRDAQPAAKQVYERLAAHFHASNVFMDVDSIPSGVDFRNHLNEAVGRCDVLLALVGDLWLSVTGDSGQRRLDDKDDYVRIEIESALARGIPVIPVLVSGAKMPTAEQLPSTLRDFSFRNALPVRPEQGFEEDLDRLIRSLESHRPFAWVECANCYETVIPMSNGTCPACRQPTTLVEPASGAGSREPKAMLRVVEGSALPSICCTCARPTDRVLRMRRTRKTGGEILFVRILLLLMRQFHLYSETAPTVRDVVLHIPQCIDCSKRHPLNPEYVDFERRSMKFLVHPEFRRRYEEKL
jgi:hypothetical protein